MAKVNFDFADVKPSVLNALIITMMVLVMFAALKYLMGLRPIPGLSDLVAYVTGGAG